MFTLYSDPMQMVPFFVVFYITSSIALYFISKKLEVPRPWLAFVPLANLYQFVRCSGESLFHLALLLVPCFNIYIFFFLWWHIGERLGKFGFLSVLMVVPIVGWFIPLYYAWGPAPPASREPVPSST